jgi:hypothetical protein
MPFLILQYQDAILTLLKKLFKKNLSIFFGFFHPTCEAISLYLKRATNTKNSDLLRFIAKNDSTFLSPKDFWAP